MDDVRVLHHHITYNISPPLRPSLQTPQPFSNILLEQGLIILVPSTQGRSTFHDVARIPHDPQRIYFTLRLIIRYEDIEVAHADFVQHV